MAQLTFRSAGVSAREIDLSGPTSTEAVGIPAGVLSTTQKGPAFVPTTVATVADYRNIFGDPVEYIQNGPLAAVEWLRSQQSLLQLKVLGIGDGSQRTDSGLNRGKVTNAGFVVGDQQPQSVTSGALGNNVYAYSASTGPTAAGSLGRTWFLGCFMSQSSGSSIFSDAGLAGAGVPVMRGVLMVASGVIPQLSSSAAPSAGASAGAASFAANTVSGSFSGSVNLSSGRQEFVLLLNGHKGSDSFYPNVITASFDPDAPNYFGSLLNKDPLKLEEAGYVLYSHFDLHSAYAVPTGSSIVLNAQGGTGNERIAFIVTGSQTRNSGSATAPNYENFEDRFRAPSTPWFISQKFGGKAQNLFKVWSLSDGEFDNSKIKISIENIAPSNTDTTDYGSFDLLVRDYTDSDSNKVVLEAWRGLTLDPTSTRYIGKLIGDYHTYFNFDTDEESQKLETDGNYPNRSRYIRVEIADGVETQEVDGTALPMGFRGPQHLVTSGSAPLMDFSDATYFSKNNVFRDVVQPPVPLRTNLNKGSGSSQYADRTLYWGIQFEKLNNVSEVNASKALNPSLPSFSKYYPIFQEDWMNFAVKDNEGVADTAENGILDADRFNNNQFSLEKVKIKYLSTSNTPDLNNLTSWTYVRAGNISNDTVNLTRALTVNDLLDPSTRGIAKFTVFMEGGFDGVRPFNVETKNLTNKAAWEELNNSSRGFTNGPTVKAYEKGIAMLDDNQDIDMQLFVMPNIRVTYLTDTAIQMVESARNDCFYIMDIEERDTNDNLVLNSDQEISVRYTANNFRTRGLNSSFAGVYFPDQIVNDTINRKIARVAPSVVALGAYGVNDKIGYPWNAPAGFARGALSSVVESALELNRNNMDDLYSVNINPIVSFATEGPTVWGQKTVLAKQSAFERINVRRMLLALRREIKAIGLKVLFEPGRADTISRFQESCKPVLKTIQDQGGIETYTVRIDTTTTTQVDLENKTIKGKIFLVPSRTLEFLELDFVVTNRGTFASDS